MIGRNIVWVALSLLALTAQPRRLMRVVGSSMAPTYADGEWLTTLPADRDLRRGDVVVADTPRGTVVKRVALLPGERHLQFLSKSGWVELDTARARFAKDKGRYRYVTVPQGTVYLVGDHLSMSIDSRDFGPVPLAYVRRIVEDLRPPRRDSDLATLKNPAWKSS